MTAMTCLSLAIKLYEYKRILIPGTRSTMETILRLGRGSYTMEQVEAKEYEILNSIQWMVHPPTPQLFLHYLSEEHGSYQRQSCHQEARDFAIYLIEMSALDYSFIAYKASEIAIAALLNATEFKVLKPFSASASIDFSFLGNLRAYQTPRVVSCQERLKDLYTRSGETEAVADISTEKARMPSPVSVTAGFLG